MRLMDDVSVLKVSTKSMERTLPNFIDVLTIASIQFSNYRLLSTFES